MCESDIADYSHLKVMAGIGGVCVQWALLEHLILGMIATNEGMHLDRVYLIFGSLDMKPRLDMAINLARAAKTPVQMVKRIEAIRTALREERLAERRNQAVHGVHKAAGRPDSIQLTMPRWSGPRRTETVSALDLYQLGTRLAELGIAISAVGDIHQWKMRVLDNRLERRQRQLAIEDTSTLMKIAKRLKDSGQRLWRRLKF